MTHAIGSDDMSSMSSNSYSIASRRILSWVAFLTLAMAVRAPAQEHAPATLAGRVVQQNGSPVPSATVRLTGTTDTATTDDAGHFIIHAGEVGAYVLNVRRLGFEPTRVAVTLSASEPTPLTVTLTRVVPLLPTVTTTAAERAAYRSVGFEQRMQAGVGYFLTYEQIVKRQAEHFSDLIQTVPGFSVTQPRRQFGAAIRTARGRGPNCVSYVIDGNPQRTLPEYDATGAYLGPESPDHLFDESDIGAMEIYQPSERPVQWGSDWCGLIVIWTRTRMRLRPAPESAANNGPAGGSDIVHGTAVVPTEDRCTLPTSSDTMDFPIYATLHTDAPHRLPRKVWARYSDSVLSVIERWSAVPTDLALPSFGLPFVKDSDGSDDQPLQVSPALSSVITFTLDSVGVLTGARVAASSLAGAADTSLLATLARASTAHAFPPIPHGPDSPRSADFDLLVSLTEPAEDVTRATLGQLEVPVWRLSQKATLEAGGSGPLPLRPKDSHAQSVSVEMVVDPNGQALVGSAHALTVSGGQRSGAINESDKTAMGETLKTLHFEPAKIGACRVPDLVIQPIALLEHDSAGR